MKKCLIAAGVFTVIVLAGCQEEQLEEQPHVKVEINTTVAQNLSQQDKLLLMLENDLQQEIATLSKLDEEGISIMLSADADNNVSSAIVLPIENPIAPDTLQQIVKSVIAAITAEQNMKITEDHITITDTVGKHFY